MKGSSINNDKYIESTFENLKHLDDYENKYWYA